MLTAILGSTLLGAVIAGGASLIGSFLNRKSTREANKQNQENFENQMQYQQTVDNRNFEQTEKWNAQNQYNLENQFSIAAKDAAKNGINPLSLNGASAGTASFMSGSSSGSPSAPNIQPTDYSAIGDVFNTVAQAGIERIRLKQQKSIADDQINVAEINATTAKKQAETDEYRAETDRLLAEAQIANLSEKTQNSTLIGTIQNNVEKLSDVIPEIVPDTKPIEAGEKLVDYIKKNAKSVSESRKEQIAEIADDYIKSMEAVPLVNPKVSEIISNVKKALKDFFFPSPENNPLNKLYGRSK